MLNHFFYFKIQYLSQQLQVIERMLADLLIVMENYFRRMVCLFLYFCFCLFFGFGFFFFALNVSVIAVWYFFWVKRAGWSCLFLAYFDLHDKNRFVWWYRKILKICSKNYWSFLYFLLVYTLKIISKKIEKIDLIGKVLTAQPFKF